MQDGGWSARDGNGAKLPVFRANGPFFAVALTAGDHEVRLTYWPPGFIAGAWISVGTAVVLVGAALRRMRAGQAPPLRHRSRGSQAHVVS